MIPRKLWPFLLPVAISMLSTASTPNQVARVSRVEPLVTREEQIWKPPVHNSQFADVPRTSARSQCEQAQPPEALTTPNPVLGTVDPSIKIKVSFIVGTDGRVHSPLILESAGSTEDHAILETVRAWRYRPGMCNGVPTETEGKIEFSSR
jgi:TonB family protein